IPRAQRFVRRRRQRTPEIALAQRERESLRQDADNEMRPPAEHDLPADRGRIAGELPAPELVADDDDRLREVRGLEAAAERWRDAEQRQEPGRDVDRADAF